MHTRFCAQMNESTSALPESVWLLFAQNAYWLSPQPAVTFCWNEARDERQLLLQYSSAASPTTTRPFAAFAAVTRNSQVIFCVNGARHLAGTVVGMSAGDSQSLMADTETAISATTTMERVEVMTVVDLLDQWQTVAG